jgi:uncharacterized protein (DUF1697 family)
MEAEAASRKAAGICAPCHRASLRPAPGSAIQSARAQTPIGTANPAHLVFRTADMPSAVDAASAITTLVARGRRLAMKSFNAPMRYVALLRGINVGGRTLLKMAELKACVEALGLEEVSTYIASGNLLFESGATKAPRLETLIEEAIEKRFRLPVKVVVLDRAAYSRIVNAIPKGWVGDASLRVNIAFVRRGTDPKQVVRELQPDPSIEHVKAVAGAILWATKRDALNRSVMRKLIGGAAYKELTVRNLNTTLKLHELLEQGS